MPLTDDQIKQALAVCEAATKEPWVSSCVGNSEDGNGLFIIWPDTPTKHRGNRVADVKGASNCAFIVSARAHYAEALRDLLEARQEIAQLRADLAYQTDARSQDGRDNRLSFRQWKKEFHDPLQARITELETEVNRWHSNADCERERVRDLEAELTAYRERFHRHDGPMDFVAEV